MVNLIQGGARNTVSPIGPHRAKGFRLGTVNRSRCGSGHGNVRIRFEKKRGAYDVLAIHFWDNFILKVVVVP